MRFLLSYFSVSNYPDSLMQKKLKLKQNVYTNIQCLTKQKTGCGMHGMTDPDDSDCKCGSWRSV